MKMLRTPSTLSTLSSNRSLLVLLVLLLAFVGIAAGRTLIGSSFEPAAPVYGPAENPAFVPPAVQALSAPTHADPVPSETAIPDSDAAIPAPAPIYPTAPTAPPAATPVPRATLPGPSTSPIPGGDIHSIAPEGMAPGFNPPPGRE